VNVFYKKNQNFVAQYSNDRDMKPRLHLKLFFLVVIINHGFTKAQTQSPNLDWVKGYFNVFVSESTTDANGNVYTVGNYKSGSDFDPSSANQGLPVNSFNANEGFVQKSDPSGNFLWVKRIGQNATTSTNVLDIMLDNTGNIIIGGTFNGTIDVDPSTSVVNRTSTGNSNIFIIKLDASGNYVWDYCFGGTSFETFYSLALDASSNVFVTGTFESTTDFDASTATFNLTPVLSGGSPSRDMFALKINANGTFNWARKFGSSLFLDIAEDCTIDGLGNLIMVGNFQSTVDFDPGTSVFNLSATALYNGFVLKLSNAGNFVWAVKLEGSGYSVCQKVTTNSSNEIFVGGIFSATADLNPSTTVNTYVSNGSDDCFLLKLNASGNYQWSSVLGGNGQDFLGDVSTNALDEIAICGQIAGNAAIDLNAGGSTVNYSVVGGKDFFLKKLDASGNLVSVYASGGTNDDYGTSTHFLSNGNVLVSGKYTNTVNFNPGATTTTLTGSGSINSFLANYSFTNIPVSIANEAVLKNSIVYPNPFSNELRIETQNELEKEVVIHNSIGQVVYSSKYYKVSGTIKTETWPSGIYYITFKNRENTMIQKLIKN
jgi:hypothetical protein